MNEQKRPLSAQENIKAEQEVIIYVGRSSETSLKVCLISHFVQKLN